MTSSIVLIPPTTKLVNEFRAFVRDQLESGSSDYLPFLYLIQTDFDAYVARLIEDSKPRPVSTERVPQSTFWLIQQGDDGATRVLGTSRLRHDLSRRLRIMGGHIGYGIRPGEWGKGYGTQILALTLREARKLGLGRCCSPAM